MLEEKTIFFLFIEIPLYSGICALNRCSTIATIYSKCKVYNDMQLFILVFCFLIVTVECGLFI